MNGKSSFFNKDHANYRLINSPKIEKVLFILDVDYEKNDYTYGGYAKTKKELKKIIKILALDIPCDYYLVCDPSTKEGYFETLLFSCVSDDLKKCYQDFISCSNFKGKENYKTVMTKLHELASPEKPYDYENKNFKEIKEKLINLFE